MEGLDPSWEMNGGEKRIKERNGCEKVDKRAEKQSKIIKKKDVREVEAEECMKPV